MRRLTSIAVMAVMAVCLFITAASAQRMYVGRFPTDTDTVVVDIAMKVTNIDTANNIITLKSKGRGRTMTYITVPADQLAQYTPQEKLTLRTTWTKGEMIRSGNFIYSATAAELIKGLDTSKPIMKDERDADAMKDGMDQVVNDRQFAIMAMPETVAGRAVTYRVAPNLTIKTSGNKASTLAEGEAKRGSIQFRPVFRNADDSFVYQITSIGASARTTTSDAW